MAVRFKLQPPWRGGGGGGVGAGRFDRLDAISQGEKNSRFSGPNPLPLAHVMDLDTSNKSFSYVESA